MYYSQAIAMTVLRCGTEATREALCAEVQRVLTTELVTRYGQDCLLFGDQAKVEWACMMLGYINELDWLDIEVC